MRRRGFFTPIIGLGAAGITAAAILYYGAVFLLLEKINAMPDVPQCESSSEDLTGKSASSLEAL